MCSCDGNNDYVLQIDKTCDKTCPDYYFINKVNL
jgi:hypothetical protein